MAQHVRNIDPDRLWEANTDYVDRIEAEGVFVVYDATLDTLFVEFGGPKEALSEHAIDNVMVRIDPDTLQIVGVEVLDFFTDFLPCNRLFREAIHDLGLNEGIDARVTLMKPRFKAHVDFLSSIFPQLIHSVGGQK